MAPKRKSKKGGNKEAVIDGEAVTTEDVTVETEETSGKETPVESEETAAEAAPAVEEAAPAAKAHSRHHFFWTSIEADTLSLSLYSPWSYAKETR